MAIYLYVLAIVALLAFALRPDYNNFYKKTFVIICFILLIVVASIRSYTVGNDTGQFWDAYVAIGLTPWDSLNNFRYEWGFLILCKLLNYVTSDPQLLLVASSCIINVPIGLFLYRNSRNVGLSTFLYVALCFYTSNMNIMREAMAVSIGLLAIEAIKENHLVKYVLLAALACLFHVTGVICFAYIIIWNVKFDKRAACFYLALAIALFVYSSQASSIVTSLLGREELYGADYTGSNYYGALIKMLFAAFLTLITLNYYIIGKRAGEELPKADNFFCHMLALWLVFLVMSMRIEIISRICMYFQLFPLVAIPNALYFSKSKNDTAVLVIVIAAITLVYFLVIGIFRPEWDGAIPYTVSPYIAFYFMK